MRPWRVVVLVLRANACVGVDVTSGKVPSKTEMFRLLMKTEIRESAMKMATAFQEAGLDLSSKVWRLVTGLTLLRG